MKLIPVAKYRCAHHIPVENISVFPTREDSEPLLSSEQEEVVFNLLDDSYYNYEGDYLLKDTNNDCSLES